MVEAQQVDGLTVLYRDADIVVVDKPVGVAAHPSPGWTGPTVLGALAGRGSGPARPGAQERQGIVHRLDVGTTGVMVVALSERAYSVLKDAFRDRTVEKIYHAVVQGHPDPSVGHHRRPDRPAPDVGLEVRRGGRRPGRASPTTRRWRRFRPPACCRSIWRPAAPTRSGCTSRPCGTRVSGTGPTAPIPTLAARLGLTRQWLHARSLAFAHPADGRWVEFTSPYPADLAHALEVLAR